MPDPEPLTLADIEAAAARIRGVAVETPLLESEALGRRCGGRVFLKAEMLQRTGSFKFRGAFNRLAQLSSAERARGVVAFSSGNHAQAVAAAARLVGTPATIVMPRDAPSVKLQRTRALGAEVVLYDRLREDRAGLAAGLAAERGLVIVPPYDDYAIMAGQGTLGLEVCRQAAAAGVALDAVLVPCSGGGLIAGIATAAAALSPATRVAAVEPEGFDDLRRSLAAGERLANAPGASSICDALLVATPGALTFPIHRKLVAGALAVGDAQVRAAMAFAFAELRLVVEPGGAAALAALLAGRYAAAGKTVGLVLSGGNVDADLFASCLSSETRG